MRPSFRAALGLLLLMLEAGGCACLERKLTRSGAAAGDWFGYSVAASSSDLAVGVPHADPGARDAGSVVIFEPCDRGWRQHTVLTAPDPEVDDSFGLAVALDGSSLVVGDPGDRVTHKAQGSAYVFTKEEGTWRLQQKLVDDAGGASALFGESVAIDAHRIVVGARGVDNSRGVAFVFVRREGRWVREARLEAHDGAQQDSLGTLRAVAIEGDRVIAGAPQAGNGRIGSAYIFVRDKRGWHEEAKIRPTGAKPYWGFGRAVALSGGRAFVGAADDYAGEHSGSVYVYERSGAAWSMTQRLAAADAATDAFFGNSIAARGDWLVIGSGGDDDGANVAGSAYVFQRTGKGWRQVSKLLAFDPAVQDEFGHHVAMSETTIAIGTPYADARGRDSGAVYVFARGQLPELIGETSPRDCIARALPPE